MTINRMDKIDKLLLHQLSLVLNNFFPDLILSVTRVETTKDLQFSKIWISIICDIEKNIEKITKKKSLIKKELAKNIYLRKIPDLIFVSDTSSEYAVKIEKLIKNIDKKS